MKPTPAKPQADGPRHYVFEVVDVRLTPAVMEDSGTEWLAYGALARQASTTRATSDSSGGSPNDQGGSGDGRGSRGDRRTR